MSKPLKTAESMRKFDSAIVQDLHGPAELQARLRELGFIPGVKISCDGISPLGEPMIFFVGTATVALRKNEAQCLILS